MAEKKKILVTVSDACISCGNCLMENNEKEELELFNLDSGKSEFVYKGEITTDIEVLIEKAADSCPVGAIEVSEV